jgi:GNAT superfamily N-acetyltransferase
MSITIRRHALDNPTEFLEFAESLHSGDPSYVPALKGWLKRRLKPSNPFFKDAELVLFGAYRGDKMVGRISALVDRRFNQSKGEAVCWFGFVDFEDSSEIATALFDAINSQAYSWGCTVLRGARNLTRLEDPGVTVSGFDRLPPMLASHHPAYIAQHLETAGFTKHHDLFAYEIDLFQEDGSPTPVPEALHAKADAVDIPGLVVRPFRWRHVWADMKRAFAVFDQAYRTVPDTATMPFSQFVSLALPFMIFTSPHLVQLALVDGKPAGFVLCLPEINEAMGEWRGTFGPRGALRFARRFRKIETAAFKLIGVMPEYRGTGLHAKMILAVVDGVRKAGYDRGDGSRIDERNKPMRGVVEGIGMEVYRTYRFFERTVVSV